VGRNDDEISGIDFRKAEGNKSTRRLSHTRGAAVRPAERSDGRGAELGVIMPGLLTIKEEGKKSPV